MTYTFSLPFLVLRILLDFSDVTKIITGKPYIRINAQAEARFIYLLQVCAAMGVFTSSMGSLGSIYLLQVCAVLGIFNASLGSLGSIYLLQVWVA